jgi:hypothetical protein
MKRTIFASAAFLSLALAGSAFAQTEAVTITSGDKTHAFTVDVAGTRAAAEAGLAGRTELAKDGGLLIDFRKVGDPITPTMKGVTVPLDMLFLAPDGTVVGIVKQARPGSLRPLWTGLNSVATLEIAGGQVTALGLKTGDKVRAQGIGSAG